MTAPFFYATENERTMSNEIERLRGEIAILREVVECADSLIQFQYTGSRDAMSRLFVLALDAKTALEDTQCNAEWLVARDAKVRNDALEDAACTIESNAQDISWRGLDDLIRDLKSKEE